jgi:hypothetical protein
MSMNAFSRLKRLLKQQQISVPELHRRIRAQGLNVNVKSLYRLIDDSQPVDRLDMRVAGAICQVCAIPLSDWIVFEEEAGALRTLSAKKQTRLDTLMTRNNAGSLTDQERVELQTLVREAEDLTLTNARLLAQQRQRLEPVSSGSDRAA